MINKFSFAQMTSNANGKTSMSGCMGGLLCTASAIGFLWGAVSKQNDLINQSVAYAVIGAGLLGYRKSREQTDGPIATIADTSTIVKTDDTATKADPSVDADADVKPLNS